MTHPNRQFKSAIYEHFARIGKALSSPRRLELIDLLCQAPRTVETLARASGMSLANTSRHLQVLRAARLVEAEKDGLYVTYRIAGDSVGEFYLTLGRLAKSRFAEIERVKRDFLESRDGFEPVAQEELIERVRSGEAIVLDVRPAEEYRQAHLPGALSVPLGELERWLAERQPGREIVAYCRGPYCVLAAEAVQRLRERGFRAARLEDGVLEWKDRGFALARETADG